MRIDVCDICGEALDYDGYDSDNEFKLFPKGRFGLDFSQIVLNGKGQPYGFRMDTFHMCLRCHAMINQAIFDKIEKIQETIHRPTVVLPFRKFPPEPFKIGDDMSPACGRVDD